MISSSRLFVILFGVVAASILLWAGVRVNGTGLDGYVLRMGALGAAGAVLGLSLTQAATMNTIVVRSLRGATAVTGLLVVVVAVVGLWVLAAHAPPGELARDVRSWSDSIGVLGLVQDLEQVVPVIAFGLGTVVASLIALSASDRRRARSMFRDAERLTEAPAERRVGDSAREAA